MIVKLEYRQTEDRFIFVTLDGLRYMPAKVDYDSAVDCIGSEISIGDHYDLLFVSISDLPQQFFYTGAGNAQLCKNVDPLFCENWRSSQRKSPHSFRNRKAPK